MRSLLRTALIVSVVFVGTLLGWPQASAQVKPKIYILFDTSGSMLQDTQNDFQTGDGSPLCGGDGQSSRVYQLKAALFDVLQGFGATEVDYALATFPMFSDPNRTPLCPVGAGNSCSSNTECTRSGEVCEGLPLGANPWLPCVSPAFCNGYDCDGSTNKCADTCNGSLPCQFGTICQNNRCVTADKYCVSPCSNLPSCSGHYFTAATTLSEIDYAEDRYGCKISTHAPKTQTNADCGAAGDPCAAWYTQYKQEVLKVPFGKAPEDVMLYFDQQEDHPLSTNPEVRVGNGWWTPLGKSLFYAHGYFHKEVALPASDYRKKCERLTIAFFTDGDETCNDTSSDPFHSPVWAGKLKQDLGVVTHTVAIDAAVTLLSDIAKAGGGLDLKVSGTTSSLKQAFLDIIAKSLPPSETCNGEDDDCDNLIDEDFPQKGAPCNNGKVGACFRQGVFVCKADGSGVECGADDATGTTEVCDGVDNDCNGQVDEIPGCVPCVPQPEICNGKDDNCNQQTDENIPPGPCGKDVGECKAGTSKCENGQTLCEGGVGPTEEICDGLDNDCDGQRDGIVDLCYPFDDGCDVATGTCQGQCALGSRKCTASETGGVWSGAWSDCTGAVGPTKEVCDGVDNDCDGAVDDDAECPGGSQCIEGQCSPPCGSVEFGCPASQVCKDGWCVRDTCNVTTCEGTGGICKGGECIDPCVGVTCGKFEKCERGTCVDDSCYKARPCPSGERCVQGVCVADPCAGLDCGPGQFCLGGKCLDTCEALACSAGQLCKVVGEGASAQTQCVADPCAGVLCNSGLVCVEGTCEVDPCETIACPAGQVCVSGECEGDPCETIKCGTSQRCDKGQCISAVVSTSEILATGSGGVSCTVGRGEGLPPVSLSLLLLLALVRRRRR